MSGERSGIWKGRPNENCELRNGTARWSAFRTSQFPKLKAPPTLPSA